MESQLNTSGKDQNAKVSSSWDDFNISKLMNVGFKLEYVNPKCCGDKLIGDINLDDISAEVEYLQNVVLCYVLYARIFIVYAKHQKFHRTVIAT
ncbi:hypothetical protein FXO38_36240 [Capsicum annuum]|nr:hypothetical protein FXO38_36240 [Capsicum annuum]KAF3618240.1 hypothetical protein FXO37_34276 [Capsicum annuum]